MLSKFHTRVFVHSVFVYSCIRVFSINNEYFVKQTYSQESPGWIFLFKLVTFSSSFFENIQKSQCFGKIDWSMNSGKGRGIARDIKKSTLIFKTQQKVVTKLGQFTKLGPFSKFQLF